MGKEKKVVPKRFSDILSLLVVFKGFVANINNRIEHIVVGRLSYNKSVNHTVTSSFI